jgi:hypothetical protein
MLYRYTADKAARALWAPWPVPWDGRLCTRPEGGAWHGNVLVKFTFPGKDGRNDRLVIVPWRRLRRVT